MSKQAFIHLVEISKQMLADYCTEREALMASCTCSGDLAEATPDERQYIESMDRNIQQMRQAIQAAEDEL